MEIGDAAAGERGPKNLRVVLAQAPQFGAEYSGKSARGEKAQLAKSRAQIGKDQHEEERYRKQKGVAPRGKARTHQHRTLNLKAHWLAAQNKEH